MPVNREITSSCGAAILVVPWEHLIKCNAFWQLHVRIVILCQILFLVMSQQGGLSVGRRLRVIAGLVRCYCFSGMINVEYNLILNPLQNNNFIASIKRRILYWNLNVWPVVKWWHKKPYLQTLFITIYPLSLSTLYTRGLFFMSCFYSRIVGIAAPHCL